MNNPTENEGSAEARKKDIIYIMGPAHSGSTLLTFLLSRHPEISTIGELKATSMGPVEKYTCSCGQPIMDCQFWKTVCHEMHKTAPLFSLSNFRTHFVVGDLVFDKLMYASVRDPGFENLREMLIEYIPTIKPRLSRILAYNEKIADIISSLIPGRYFLDSSKDPARLKQLLKIDNWNIKVIQITRDGRGSCYSYKKGYQIDMVTAANEWRQTCSEFFHIKRYIPENNFIALKYEDLCLDTKQTMDRLYTFLGIPGQAANPDDRPQHILGNDMRMKISQGIFLDEKWKKELTKRDLDTFHSIAGEINLALGYPADQA